MQNINQSLLQFIHDAPSPFHAVDCIRRELDAAGFTALSETEPWSLEPGGRYYVTRNGSSIIAFRPAGGHYHFRICVSHDDSPAFRLKDSPVLAGPDDVRVVDHVGCVYFIRFAGGVKTASPRMHAPKTVLVRVPFLVEQDRVYIRVFG